MDEERAARTFPRIDINATVAAFDHFPLGMMVLTAGSHRILHANHTLCEILGTDEAGLAGAELAGLLPDATRIEPLLEPTAPGEGRRTRLRHGDGRWLDVEITVAPIRESGAQTAGWLAGVRDVTERNRRDHELADREARLRALVDAIPDRMLRLSRDGVCLDCKDESGELFAQTRTDVIGRRIEEFAPAEFATLCRRHAALARERGGVCRFDLSMPDSSGVLRQWEVRVVPSGDDETIAILRDLTVMRASAERMLLMSRMMEQSTDAILLTTPEFDITYCNGAFEALLGWKREELLGQRPSLFFGRDDSDAYPIYEALRAGGYVATRRPARRKDGSWFHCDFWIR
jgi:PAS domain S-box-containing protein